MQIVLSGALPDPNAARELTPHLLKTAPTLVRWFEQSRATLQDINSTTSACTSYEHWLLESNGYVAQNGQNFSAGLGPLWANNITSNDAPIWLAELVHVSPSRDGAALLPANQLSITPEQSTVLFESAQGLLEGTGFTLHHDGTQHWLVDIPADFMPRSVSPELVSITSVNDWWPQDIRTRPWRRLVNELQMLWFDHPVNQARNAQGLPAINSLWLFGGAKLSQLNKPATAQADIYDALATYSLKQDWGGWIAALAELEKSVFHPLAQKNLVPDLILLGRESIIRLTPSKLKLWTNKLPSSRNAWRQWWSHQN